MVYIVYTIQKNGAFMSKSSPVKTATAPTGANGSAAVVAVSDVKAPAKKSVAKAAAAPKATAGKAKPAAAKPVAEKAASKPAAAKAAAAKPAAKVAAKPAAKAALKAAKPAAAKPAAKPAEAKPASKAAAAKTAAKPAEKTAETKNKDSDKLVRDSFTMPEQEYAVLGQVKKACLKAGFEIKKSELLRIGVALISQIDLATLQNVLAALPQLKTGRPKKG